MSGVISSAGTRLYVSTSVPSDVSKIAGFSSLTYGEIGEVVSLNEIGASKGFAQHQPLKTGIVKSTPGFVGYGQMNVQFGKKMDDVGQALLASYADGVNRTKRLSVKVKLQDGSLLLFTAKIGSFTTNISGGNSLVSGAAVIQITSPIHVIHSEDGPVWEMFNGGYAGFYANLDPEYGLCYTTATGNVLAVNPGDPVGRVESMAGGLTLKQPSSALRPVLATIPKVGVFNSVPTSAIETAVSGLASTPSNSPQKFKGKPLRSYTASTVAELHGVAQSLGSAATRLKPASEPHTFKVRVVIPTGSDVTRIWMRGRASSNGSGFRFLYSGGMLVPETMINPFGTEPPPAPTMDQAFAYKDLEDPNVWVIGFRIATSSNPAHRPTTFDVRFSPGSLESDAGTANTKIELGGWEVNTQEGVFPYQESVNLYEVYQDGVENVWFLHGNGTQYMGFDVDTFGAADFYADSSQEWTARVSFSTFTQDAAALLAESSETSPWSSRFLLGIGGAVAGIPYSVIRAGSTTAPWGSPVVPSQANTGAPQSMAVRWNGSIANGWRNGVLLSSGNPIVGVGTQSKSSITFMHRDAANPKSIFTGYANSPFFVDRSLQDEEIQRIMP